jgi:hypothetical protein
VKDGSTLPFVVTRSWSAPAGRYLENWYLIDPETREVIHQGAGHERLIWGLQGLTEISDEVTDPLPLAAGDYEIVFSLGGELGQGIDVKAVQAGDEAA